MRCNNKGQLAGYEALIILVLLGASGWMFYLYAHKPSDSQIYQSGSKPKITEFSPHPGFGGCVMESLTENWGQDDKPIVNKAVR